MRKDKMPFIVIPAASIIILGVAMQFYLKDYSARAAGQRAVEKEVFKNAG